MSLSRDTREMSKLSFWREYSQFEFYLFITTIILHIFNKKLWKDPTFKVYLFNLINVQGLY